MSAIDLAGIVYSMPKSGPYEYSTQADYEERIESLLLGCPGVFKRSTLGISAEGRPIHLVSCGRGRFTVLLYGFPHPDENLGAGTVMRLLGALAERAGSMPGFDASWHIIPAVDVDLAHLNDRARSPGERSRGGYPLKPRMGEIDFCMDSPRPESQVLLRTILTLKPDVLITLHDAAHWIGYEPSYVILNPMTAYDRSAVARILFPGGVPQAHECVVPISIPGQNEERALCKHVEKALPGCRTIWAEINAVDRAALGRAGMPRELDGKPYISWALALSEAIQNGVDVKNHCYGPILKNRFELLNHQIQRQLASARRLGPETTADGILNLHASLLISTGLLKIARSLDPRVPEALLPAAIGGDLPSALEDQGILVPYPVLVDRQYRVVLLLAKEHLIRLGRT